MVHTLIFDEARLVTNLHSAQRAFIGHIYYAVKANPHLDVIDALSRTQIDGFDVASVEECRRVRSIAPASALLYTHPIKSRAAIESAYREFGVTTFVVDSIQELEKIRDVVPASAIEIMVRFKSRASSSSCSQDLNSKFGADLEEGMTLLKCAKDMGAQTGASFHVGSQQLQTHSYRDTINWLCEGLRQTNIQLSTFSVGGGMPAFAQTEGAHEITRLYHDISECLKEQPVLSGARLIAEPGRSLVHDTMTLDVEILHCDANRLFINDGIYGSLLDAGLCGQQFRITAPEFNQGACTRAYQIFGPTCDSLDVLPGLYRLPDNVSEGDRLRIHGVGAYGRALTENFNGLCAAPQFVKVGGSERNLRAA